MSQNMRYYETSSKENINIDDLMDDIMVQALQFRESEEVKKIEADVESGGQGQNVEQKLGQEQQRKYQSLRQ